MVQLTKRIIPIGNSQGIIIPSAILRLLELEIGDELVVKHDLIEGGLLIKRVEVEE